MELFDKITNRLADHLVEHLGFTRQDDQLAKKISVTEYVIAPYVVNLIIQRKAYSWADPLDAITALLIENYVAATVMENTLDNVDFTEEERSYFTCPEDGDEEDEDIAYSGWTDIESWVSEQNICLDREELKRFVASVAER